MGNAHLKWSGLLSTNLRKKPKRCKEPNSVGMAFSYSFHLWEVLIVKQHILCPIKFLLAQYPKRNKNCFLNCSTPPPQLAPLLKNKKGNQRKHRWIVANEVHNLLLITVVCFPVLFQFFRMRMCCVKPHLNNTITPVANQTGLPHTGCSLIKPTSSGMAYGQYFITHCNTVRWLKDDECKITIL